MLIINGCVSFETDLFNHSKGLFFNRALDKLSECQYNMSFHVQKWQDISWLDVPSKKEANKKGGEKTMGGNRKKRKRKRKKKRKGRKKKRKKKGEVTKQKERKGEGRGEEDRMKNRRKKKEKRVGMKYLTKGSTVLGLNPVHWYI